MVWPCPCVCGLCATPTTTGGADKRIKVWDAKTYEVVHSFTGPNASVIRVCFSAAGDRLLAGCNDNACYVMVVGQNRLFCSLTGHTEKACAAAPRAGE